MCGRDRQVAARPWTRSVAFGTAEVARAVNGHRPANRCFRKGSTSMSSPPDPLDHAWKRLRSRSASLSDSFSLELEDRLMRVQQQQLQRGRWKTRGLVVGIVLCGVLAAAAASYAATGGWRGWLWTFWIESDGVVTNKHEESVGREIQNEDGSYTTIIRPGENDQSYSITTPQSSKGKTIKMFAVPPEQVREDRRRRGEE